MTPSHSRRSSGRREALLQAAAEVFFEQGYSATSIDAIIERTGGSKRNIYTEFGSKEGLFTAIVTNNADIALSSLSLEETIGRSLHDTLIAFGQRLMKVYMTSTVVAVYRIAVTEASRFPDLARSLYDQGPGRAASQLAEVLVSARDRGDVKVDDCAGAAGHFVAMLRDNTHLQVILGLREPPSDEEISKIVTSAVDVFLNGIRAR